MKNINKLKDKSQLIHSVLVHSSYIISLLISWTN